MRMTRLSFRLRTLMAAVAGAAVLFWVVGLYELSNSYGRMVAEREGLREYYARLADGEERYLAYIEENDADRRAKPDDDKLAYADIKRMASLRIRNWRENSQFEASMALKYRRAARYPSLPVPPDPPELR